MLCPSMTLYNNHSRHKCSYFCPFLMLKHFFPSVQNIFHHLSLPSLCTSCFLTWNQLAPYLFHTKPCVFADSGITGTYLCGPALATCWEASALSSTSLPPLLPSHPIPVCLSVWDAGRRNRLCVFTTVLISLGQRRGQESGAAVKADVLQTPGWRSLNDVTG